jgi:hypothetical protein
VKKIRSYGTLCSKCAKLFEIGKIELETEAQLADLRTILSHQGWQDKAVFCPHCKASRNCTLFSLMFVDLSKPPY